MPRHRQLGMKLDPEEEKLMLPSSSEDDDDSEEEHSDSALSEEEELEIKDPFEKEESDFDDSDSDGAPEALSFHDAYEDSKAQKKQLTKVIKTHLEERKKKRKELHDDFMNKKEEKRQKIDSKMLPEEFLDNLEDDSDKEKSLEEGDKTSESSEDDITMPVSPKAQIAPTEDVVAIHGPTVFKCKVLKEGKKKPKQVPEKVLNFKEQLLYGGRIRRETSARGAMLKTQKQIERRKYVS